MFMPPFMPPNAAIMLSIMPPRLHATKVRLGDCDLKGKRVKPLGEHFALVLAGRLVLQGAVVALDDDILEDAHGDAFCQ